MPEKQPVQHHYMKVLAPFSEQEMALIVQLKRFFEWAQGDPDFSLSVNSGQISDEYRARLKRIGIQFEPEELALLWKSPEIAKEYVATCVDNNRREVSEETRAEIMRYPLLALWARFSAHKGTIYRAIRQQIFRVPEHSKFDAWRMRRIAAVRNELGFFGHYIDHPILAFELGDGCNVGCWFCAFAARKLTKNLEYPEHREFFRQVAQTCVDLFGRNQASMALLYYGTEPHDNPHYLDFMKDYAEITGDVVCTSTAVGTDEKWIRTLIEFYRQETHPWPRLSVLSKGMLLKIHELYTPDELRDVELLMQMKDHPRKKVAGGRILQEENGLRGREDGHYMDGIVPQGSIACVSGFLINMVKRTIQLISPCYTSKQWPYGYRVFDERTFQDGADFRRAMVELIDANMPETPSPHFIARFRDDLAYRPTEKGFDLISPNQIHHFRGQEVYEELGRLIAAGNLTYAQLSDEIMDAHSVNPMLVAGVLQKIFDGGFLDEVNPAFHSVNQNSEAAMS